MTYQTAGNVLVALKAETTTGVALTTVTGAAQLRIVDSPGLQLDRAVVQSEENRADGLKTMGRLGFHGVNGSFSGELSPGGATDILLEGVSRGTWTTLTTITFATMTSITTGTNEVVANAGDWVGDQGIRVGDVFYISNHITANDDLNSRVTAVTSLTISVPLGTFTADASAATTGTLTVLRKLITGTTPTRRSYNIEQYDKDTDLSELFLGCRCVGFNLSCQPGQMATVQYTFLGISRTALETGTSPFFTSPSLTTTLGMIADDAAIYKDGVKLTDLTSFNLNFQIAASGEPTIGNLTSPDIFDNDMEVTGSVTGLRQDFSWVTLYDDETEFELSILLQGNESTAPKSCLGIYIPRTKIQALSAPFGGGDGAKTETRELMIGPKAAETGYDGTIVAFHSSEAP
jgi:hypothetical protein